MKVADCRQEQAAQAGANPVLASQTQANPELGESLS